MLKHLKSSIAAKILVALLVLVTVANVSCEEEAQDPLIIGHINAFTGSLSYFGETHLNAVNLAAKHVNDAGGIHGAQIEVIEKDTGVNPVQGVDAARALVSVDGAVAIVGSLASGVTLAVAESVHDPAAGPPGDRRLHVPGHYGA